MERKARAMAKKAEKKRDLPMRFSPEHVRDLRVLWAFYENDVRQSEVYEGCRLPDAVRAEFLVRRSLVARVTRTWYGITEDDDWEFLNYHEDHRYFLTTEGIALCHAMFKRVPL